MSEFLAQEARMEVDAKAFSQCTEIIEFPKPKREKRASRYAVFPRHITLTSSTGETLLSITKRGKHNEMFKASGSHGGVLGYESPTGELYIVKAPLGIEAFDRDVFAREYALHGKLGVVSAACRGGTPFLPTLQLPWPTDVIQLTGPTCDGYLLMPRGRDCGELIRTPAELNRASNKEVCDSLLIAMMKCALNADEGDMAVIDMNPWNSVMTERFRKQTALLIDIELVRAIDHVVLQSTCIPINPWQAAKDAGYIFSATGVFYPMESQPSTTDARIRLLRSLQVAAICYTAVEVIQSCEYTLRVIDASVYHWNNSACDRLLPTQRLADIVATYDKPSVLMQVAALIAKLLLQYNEPGTSPDFRGQLTKAIEIMTQHRTHCKRQRELP